MSKYSSRKHPRDEDRTLAELRDNVKAAAMKFSYPVALETINVLIEYELTHLVEILRHELREDLVYEDTRRKERFDESA